MTGLAVSLLSDHFWTVDFSTLSLASLFASQSGETHKQRWNINVGADGGLRSEIHEPIVNGDCPVYPEANRGAGPTLMVFGSSHCVMNSQLVETLALETGTAAAFCCTDGLPGKLNGLPGDLKEMIIKAANRPTVKTIVWIDFWGWGGFDVHDFTYELDLFATLDSGAKNLVFW